MKNVAAKWEDSERKIIANMSVCDAIHDFANQKEKPPVGLLLFRYVKTALHSAYSNCFILRRLNTLVKKATVVEGAQNAAVVQGLSNCTFLSGSAVCLLAQLLKKDTDPLLASVNPDCHHLVKEMFPIRYSRMPHCLSYFYIYIYVCCRRGDQI